MATCLRVYLYSICLIVFLINDISAEENVNNKTPEEISVVVFLAGDMMISNRIIPIVERYGILYPFKNVTNLIKESDISFCNLEAPFLDSDDK